MHLSSLQPLWWWASPEGARFDSQVHLSMPHWSWWCGWKSTRDGGSRLLAWPGVNPPSIGSSWGPLYTGGVFVGLCWGHSRRIHRRNSTRPASHFILVSAGPQRQTLDPTGHSSEGDWWESSNFEAWTPSISSASRTALNSSVLYWRSKDDVWVWCCQKAYDRQWHRSSIDRKHPQSCVDPVLLALNCSWCRGQSQDLRLCLAENLSGFWVTSVSKYA